MASPMYLAQMRGSRATAPRSGMKLCSSGQAFSAMLSTPSCGIEHVHLGRRLGLGRELEDDPDAVDRVLLDRLHDALRRRDQAGRAARDALAQPGIDLAARPRGSREPNWNWARRAIGMPASTFSPDTACMNPSGAMTGDLARLDVGLVDHAAHAAVMVDVAVGVDHGHHRLLRPMRVVVREGCARDTSAVVSGSIRIRPLSPSITVMLEMSKPRSW